MDPHLCEDDGRGGDTTFATHLKAGVSHESKPSQGRRLVFSTIPPRQEELFLCSFSCLHVCLYTWLVHLLLHQTPKVIDKMGGRQQLYKGLIQVVVLLFPL